MPEGVIDNRKLTPYRGLDEVLIDYAHTSRAVLVWLGVGCMAVADEIVESLRVKFEALLPHLNERAQRLTLAAEARSLGHGGIAAVARA